MNVQKEYILTLGKAGKRMDGRAFTEFRPVHVEKNPIEKAEGSARVQIGHTDIFVGVKLGLATPFPDKPDEGMLMVGAELSPISCEKFEIGPPKAEAIELARVVDRGIREAKTIDMKKLCITPGEKVWSVSLDLQIINYDGNLIDAYSLASVVALANARMPTLEDGKINYEKREGPLPLKAKPIAITVFKMADGIMFLDPNREEEEAASARITVTTKEDGNVTALQKNGGPLTIDEITQAIQLSVEKGKEFRKLL